MIPRRAFLHRSALAELLFPLAMSGALSAPSRSPKRKLTLNLVGGAIGVKADQRRIIDLAHRFGFESVEAQAGYLADLSDAEAADLRSELKAKGLVWGTSGLPVDFRKDTALYQTGLKALPRLAAGLQRAGVERVSTWLMPSHDELTYLENFNQHADRLRGVATILADHGLRLGLEYVGTTTLLILRKYPFVHSMKETFELIDAIGTGNVGIVLDSWHWWQAGDTVAQIEALRSRDIVLIDLNDAPKGVDKQSQMDNRRELPLATGVIDLRDFMNALVKIGYDGPARAEPFNQPLRDLDDEPACQATIDALQKAVALIG